MNNGIYEAIFKAKVDGMSDAEIMSKFSIGLREIERAVISQTGTNLNLFTTHPLKRLQPKNFQLETTTVWSFKSRGKWATHSGNYRGNWSPYIPRNVILRYSDPGDIVLDQFCGGGTTAVEAKLLGRRCIARDINPAAVILSRKNLSFEIDSQMKFEEDGNLQHFEPVVEIGDARDLDGIPDSSIDLICTHPPYANIVQYTDGIERDISFHDVDDFIEDMKQVARESYRVIKPAGHVAILIGDTRRKKHVVPIGFRTIEAFLKQGFFLKDLVIKRQHNCRTTGFWYTQSIKYNFLLLSHEYLAVFTKKPPEVDEPLQLKPSMRRYSVEVVTMPKPPDKMECKTTWVFPKGMKTDLMLRNVLTRYGRGETLMIDIDSEGEEHSFPIHKKFNTIVIRTRDISDCISKSITSYLSGLKKIILNLGSITNPCGHLIIHTRDVRIGEHTIAPVLDIWRIPMESFKIQEIVIITEPKNDMVIAETRPLHISHEYLLIYKMENQTQ